MSTESATSTAETFQTGSSTDRTLPNRRRFLGSLAAVGAVTGSLAASAGLTGCTPVQAAPAVRPPTALDALNFALNLEYLQASFYLYVAHGHGLETGLSGAHPGEVSGGSKMTYESRTVRELAEQLAAAEREHVIFLRRTIASIGGTPASLPTLNLAAMGMPTTDDGFITLCRRIETIGVSAYTGAIQYLTGNVDAITYVAQILETEAQHEGYFRQLSIARGMTSPAVDSQDTIPRLTSVSNTSPSTGLNPIRTPTQILQIVYNMPGITGASGGGFFPKGMTGAITTT